MNATELNRNLAERAGLSQSYTSRVVADFALMLGNALDAGEAVTMQGVGTFTLKTRPARMGRNPGTGAAIEIPEKRVVVFTPAKALREHVA